MHYRLAPLLTLVPCIAIAAQVAGVQLPALPEPRPVVDTHWGVKVEDPYRFLENTGDPAVQAYMKAQAEATQAILAKIPGRDRLLARIREIEAESPPLVTTVNRDLRGNLYYLKRGPGENQLKLYRRAAAGGAETLLVDPDALQKATGKPHAIGAFDPSPDGTLLGFQVSAGGSEIGTIRVIDIASGKDVTPPIERARFGSIAWHEDGRGFFYAQLAEGYEQRPRAERFMDMRTSMRRLDAPGKDVPVFGAGLHPEVTIERSTAAAVMEIHGQPLVAALVFHGVSPNRSLYLADREAVRAGKPKWRKVFDQSDLVASVVDSGRYIYVRSAKDAPRYKLLRMAMPEADLAKAEVVLPQGEDVIVGLGGARDGLYVTRRNGPVTGLWRVSNDAPARVEALKLPFDGRTEIMEARPELEGAVLRMSGWTRAGTHFRIAAGEREPQPLGLVPLGKYDAPSGLVAREVKVKSHDGVEVPASIISRADIKLDGRNPVQLYGYGAYGIVEEPQWTPRTLAWLEQGGVIVMSHIRGGGIHGDGWRRAGWKSTKPNTWKDGIAIAQWLIDNGYTRRERLAIYGGSAGGIFAGRAITERPDLFGAAVIGVGNTDSIRSETRANGAGNVPEYGTVTIEEEFRGLLAMSPYANVKPATAYPALLLEHGVNDSRVDVWMTLKFGTRVAAASTSGKPVLMRLEYDAGHGIGSTREQTEKRLADRWAFMLWQAGMSGFQPR